MKTVTIKRKAMNSRGFTLTELLIILVILSTLLGIAGISSKQYLDRSRAESEVMKMHADLLRAHALAMQKNLLYVISVNKSSYQISEDTNNSGTVPDTIGGQSDTVVMAATLPYPAKSALTLNIDQRGLLAIPGPGPTTITIDTAGTAPQYDCIQMYATRINLGKTDNGGNCVAR